MKFLPFLLASLLLCLQPSSAQDKTSLSTAEKTKTEQRPPSGHPNPMMARSNWSSLNGEWDYAITAKDAKETPTWEGTVKVPAAVGSTRSGIQRKPDPNEKAWYRRKFPKPELKSGFRSYLHFEDVAKEALVYLNGTLCMAHGGPGHFYVDITELLSNEGEQELVVSATNPQAGGDTGITGIVWLETVSATHLNDLQISTIPESGAVTLRAGIWGQANFSKLEVLALDGEKALATTLAAFDFNKGAFEAKFSIPAHQMWSPESPKLYPLRIRLVTEDSTTFDEVFSYCAFRKIANLKDATSHPRFAINGKATPLLGFEERGSSSPLNDAEIRAKVESIKATGFNLVRRPDSFDCSRFYYWADRLGLLIWQDLPILPSFLNGAEPATKSQLQARSKMIGRYLDHPSIVIWPNGIGRASEKPYTAGERNADLIFAQGLALPAGAPPRAALAAIGIETKDKPDAHAQLLAKIQELNGQGLSAAILTKAPSKAATKAAAEDK